MEISSIAKALRADITRKISAMKKIATGRILSLLLALCLVVGASIMWQRQQTVQLRDELEQTRMEASELMRLREENRRWREKQIPTAELEALRADHAALPRLRAELEALSKSAGVHP